MSTNLCKRFLFGWALLLLAGVLPLMAAGCGEDASTEATYADPADVTREFLLALRDQDYDNLIELTGDEAFWSEMREQGESHRDYYFTFESFHGRELEKWDGQTLLEPRYRLMTYGEGAEQEQVLEAYVPFVNDDFAGLYALTLEAQPDGSWRPIGIGEALPGEFDRRPKSPEEALAVEQSETEPSGA